MDKLLVVDGSNLLFQMFFGMPSRIINKDGKAIQGTLGFVGAFLKIVRMVKPTHAVVLFDGESFNPRRDMDADYKANRIDYSTVEEEQNPFSQLPDIYRALDYIGVKRYETQDTETDDIVAAYARQLQDVASVVISSFDSDFFQLIGNNVTVLRYRGDKTVICDCDYIMQKYGVAPNCYADFKCLTGDGADNIKGAKSVGPKTAARLINRFGSLGGVLDGADSIEQAALRLNICDCRERLLLNQRLITLDGVAELPFALEELEFKLDGGLSTNAVLTAIGLK